MSEAYYLFGVGVMAAFNPCGVVMLPSFILQLLGGKKKSPIDGIIAGLFMTFGFLAVFLLAGLVFMGFSAWLGKSVSWIAFSIGMVFILTGGWMLLGKRGWTFHIGVHWEYQLEEKRAFFLYGIAYALGSLGCTLPLFSVLVLSAFTASGFITGLMHFIFYALGMGAVILLIALASTISQSLVVRVVRSGARWMGRLSALVMIATGIYLVLYWYPYLGMK